MRSETGAGSILAVAVVAGLIALTAILLPLYTALAVKQSTLGAADAAALAAADVAVGIVAGFPCATASRVAAANGAVLSACSLDGLVVTVSVSRSILGMQLTAVATAGPPAGRRTESIRCDRGWSV